MQVFKQRVSRALRKKTRPRNTSQLNLRKSASRELSTHFWQRRFYDFNVSTARKRIQKINYMHMNPVKRGLVDDPKLWRWSSYRSYQYGEVNACKPDRAPRYVEEERNAKSASQNPHPSKNEGCGTRKG
jgi:hypothetical protein